MPQEDDNKSFSAREVNRVRLGRMIPRLKRLGNLTLLLLLLASLVLIITSPSASSTSSHAFRW